VLVPAVVILPCVPVLLLLLLTMVGLTMHGPRVMAVAVRGLSGRRRASAPPRRHLR
jgi:hypothetical protein